MKNKKIVYLLLVVVVLIWGIIFYRIFSAVGAPDNNTSNMNPTIEKSADKTEVDTFNIDGNYRDPFLGTMQVEKPVIRSTTAIKIVKEEKFIPKLTWPFIGY